MFKAHGEFELEIIDSIFVVNIKGAWNIENLHAYSLSAKNILKPLQGKPWAMVTILDDWELFTPDCLPLMKKLVRVAYSVGLIREVIVSSSSGIKIEFFEPILADCPNFKRQFVKNKIEAFEWLKSEGFDTARRW
ncbi:MAG: hypothetical protein ACI9UT_002564 [Flavobacteriales bacterium]|jgi:hypothetical protein